MRDGRLARNQISRLFQIMLEVQRGAFPNAHELGRLCDVSPRTIYRDIQALQFAGIPVHYRGDRMGYGMGRAFHATPPALEQREFLAILWLTLGAAAGQSDSLGMCARVGLVKLVEAAPMELREPARALLALFDGDHEACGGSKPNGSGCTRLRLVEALSRRSPLRVRYRAGSTDVQTRLSPYRLTVREGVWWIAGRSSVHRRVVEVPIEHIQAWESLEGQVERPARMRLGARKGGVRRARSVRRTLGVVAASPNQDGRTPLGSDQAVDESNTLVTMPVVTARAHSSVG